MRELDVELAEARAAPARGTSPTPVNRPRRDDGVRGRLPGASPGTRYLDWELPDPKGRPLDEVRATRDEIARRVAALVDELDG